jgi:DNA-binding MarR family transcriptional regulator
MQRASATIAERRSSKNAAARPAAPGGLAAPQEVLLGYRLWQAHHLWQRQVGRYLKAVGLTPVQYVLLAATYHLVSKDEVPSQIRLSTYTGVEKMMVSKNLRLLAHRGYLSRTPCPRDRRINRIRLTTAGMQILQRAFAKTTAAHASFFRSLGEDWKRVNSLLRTLIHSHLD